MIAVSSLAALGYSRSFFLTHLIRLSRRHNNHVQTTTHMMPIKLQHLFIAVLALSCVTMANKAHADRTYNFAEYRVIHALHQVRITVGVIEVPGPISHDQLASESMARSGILSLYPTIEHVYRRTATIGSHKIETKILADPPVGRGVRGAIANSQLTIFVDGRKVIDCSLTHAQGREGVTDISLLPLQKVVFVTANYKRRDFRAWFTYGDPYDEGVLNDHWIERAAPNAPGKLHVGGFRPEVQHSSSAGKESGDPTAHAGR